MAKKMDAWGEDSGSFNVVLETSFHGSARRNKEEFLKLAVLAAGAVAPTEMLLNLWETEVRYSVSPTR